MGAVRLTHIGLCVADAERATGFYRDALGFREVSRLSASGAPSSTLLRLEDVALEAIYLERDGVRIELLHYAKPGHRGTDEPRPMNQLGLTHLSLRVDDLEATVASLRARGARVLDDTRIELPKSKTRAIFVTDPDGTLIELVEAPRDPG